MPKSRTGPKQHNRDYAVFARSPSIALTRCYILRLKFSKIDFILGLRRRPCWELTALLQTPL